MFDRSLMNSIQKRFKASLIKATAIKVDDRWVLRQLCLLSLGEPTKAGGEWQLSGSEFGFYIRSQHADARPILFALNEAFVSALETKHTTRFLDNLSTSPLNITPLLQAYDNWLRLATECQ